MTLDGVADSPTRPFPRTDSLDEEIFTRESSTPRYYAITPGITVEAPSSLHLQQAFDGTFYTETRNNHHETILNMPDHRTVYVSERLPSVHCIQKSPSYGRIRRNTSSSRLSAASVTTNGHGVSRSQSLRTSRRPQSLDPSHRFRNRIASIPSDMTLPGDQVPQNGNGTNSRTSSNHSLPLPIDETDYTRLRNFSVTPKGLINRGDSFRSKSRSTHSVISNGSVHRNAPVCEPPTKVELEPAPTGSDSEPTASQGQAAGAAGPAGATSNPSHSYRVLLLGGSEVGKTALTNQFTTSEYICSYDMSQDEENEKTVNLVLNSEESELIFVECPPNEDLRPFLTTSPGDKYGAPEAAVVVYSVTNKKSFAQSKEILLQLEKAPDSEYRAVILVGNKTDLVRLRAVTVEEGRALATNQGCKFIETSVGINHQVDELLVGILTQIRLKQRVKQQSSCQLRRGHSFVAGCKARGFIKRILKKACSRSRSCDNLHVL